MDEQDKGIKEEKNMPTSDATEKTPKDISRRNALKALAGIPVAGPVSYTHLDVYKRQPFFPKFTLVVVPRSQSFAKKFIARFSASTSRWGLLKLLDLDLPEVDGVPFALQGDRSLAQHLITAIHFYESLVGPIPLIQLRLAIVKYRVAVQDMTDHLVTPHLHLCGVPFIAITELRGRVHAMIQDQFTSHHDVCTRRADIHIGTLHQRVAPQQLHLDRGREILV